MWRTRTRPVFLLALCALAATTDVVFRQRVQRPTATRDPAERYDSHEEMVVLQRLDVLFDELRRHGAESFDARVPELIDHLERMRGLHRSPGIHMSPAFKAFAKQYRDLLPEVRSLILKHQYSQGQAIVARMRSAHSELLADWKRLEKHAMAMVETDERFAQPASKLLEEAHPPVSRPPISSGR